MLGDCPVEYQRQNVQALVGWQSRFWGVRQALRRVSHVVQVISNDAFKNSPYHSLNQLHTNIYIPRSPSPHKCLLETSFCGSKPTLADNLIEPSKPETDDLEKILLKREADTTKALIPDSIKVSMVDGNLKPDPLDKPRRRGREERKEIFKREVEITKRFLEKVNIQVTDERPSSLLRRIVISHLHLINRCQW